MERQFMHKIKDSLKEYHDSMYEYHDREIHAINQKFQAKEFKSYIYGLLVGGTVGALAASSMVLYVNYLFKD